MAIVIEGGWIIGGGISITPPPPSAATAGWFGGGYTPGGPISTVDRITFATDTATSVNRGLLSVGRINLLGGSSGLQ